MEKPLAQAAGLGWQGKHTNLLGRDLGTGSFWARSSPRWTCRGMRPRRSIAGRARPVWTSARRMPFRRRSKLDARRCISYLTIEHRGPVDPELRPLMGNRIYGCDDCLAVCPWNKFAVAAREVALCAREAEPPQLADLAGLDDAGFRARFSGSPIKRIGRDGSCATCFMRSEILAIRG
jgi:epoxyqueuosine reductase